MSAATALRLAIGSNGAGPSFARISTSSDKERISPSGLKPFTCATWLPTAMSSVMAKSAANEPSLLTDSRPSSRGEENSHVLASVPGANPSPPIEMKLPCFTTIPPRELNSNGTPFLSRVEIVKVKPSGDVIRIAVPLILAIWICLAVEPSSSTVRPAPGLSTTPGTMTGSR